MPSRKTKLGETLGKKIDLKKNKEKSAGAVEKQIDSLHKTSLSRAENKSIVLQEDMIKTTVWVPKSLHKEIKIYCANHESMTLKDFVIKALEAEISNK